MGWYGGCMRPNSWSGATARSAVTCGSRFRIGNRTHERKTGRDHEADRCVPVLIGDRQAILRIAATPWAILVGTVLVLSAGIARNYDHLDLLRDKEWFIGPFVASLVTSVFVYLWVYPGLKLHTIQPRERFFLTFLNLVWLTAPCAWLYGIPVEKFTDMYTATIWNIGFLAAVSLWRVALIVRALTVLTGARWLRAALVILVPASVEMFFGSMSKALSLVGIMGGVRLPPQDQLLLTATNYTGMVSFWTFVVGVVALFFVKGPAANPLSRDRAGFPGKTLWLALVCFGLWVSAAVPGYPQIWNRYELKRLFREVGAAEAVAFASSKKREDFPAIHYLAPEPRGYGYSLEHFNFLTDESPEWLRKEWTRSAVEAHKDTGVLGEKRFFEIKKKHPEIFEGLLGYQAELKAKPKLSRHEAHWLKIFEEFLSQRPPVSGSSLGKDDPGTS